MAALDLASQRYFTRSTAGHYLVRDLGPDQAAYYAQGIAKAQSLFPEHTLKIYHPRPEKLKAELDALNLLGSADELLPSSADQADTAAGILVYACDPQGELAHWEAQQHRTVLEVHLPHLSANLAWHQEQTGSKVKVMAMVKAFSYGSGIEMIARNLLADGADALGVAYVDEGVALRKLGLKAPIMVLNPAPEALGQALRYDLEPEISNWRQWTYLKELLPKQKEPVAIHLKLETGMHRLGFGAADLPELQGELAQAKGVTVKGLLSHLAAADEREEDAFSRQQIDAFKTMADQISSNLPERPLWHLCNSYGTARFRDAHFDMVRPGISLYGYSALPEVQKELKPISTLTAPIAQVKELQMGDTVSYGRTFKAEKAMRIGVLSVGYADGLDRRFSNGGLSVFAQGQYFPIVGRVCMDMVMIDLGESKLQAGDRVELLGPHVSAAQWAEKLSTIPYEVFTSIGGRVKRIYTF